MMFEKKTQSEPTRRTFMKQAAGLSILGIAGMVSTGIPALSFAASLTKQERDKLTPDQIIAGLKAGNIRFYTGKPHQHDYLAQKRSSAAGQYPSAVILSCIDSRAPAEIVLDTGIGETFNSRIAGNISNDDILGSLEFACAAAGAKVILVMGHTACGAVKGAIDNVELGNLTGLLDKIKPAIDKTEYTMDDLRGSEILSKLEKDGKIKIVGAMYHLANGKTEFFS
jgi:carbonic anhydrase